MSLITVYDYQYNKVKGYLAKLDIKNGWIDSKTFIKEESTETVINCKDHRPLVWHSENLEDGIFELNGYCSDKNIGNKYGGHIRNYLIIKDGKVTACYDDIQDLLLDLDLASEFIDLEGSIKQVAWAEDIRRKAYRVGLELNYQERSAVWWIENRKLLES